MTEINGKMTMLEKVKLEAKNEVDKERFEKIKGRLVDLYRKLDMAKKAVKNIEREIVDYEMELKEQE